MKRRDEPYFAKHYHDAYREDAGNPKYPNPIRVAFLAYAEHKANGHARMKQREIAKLLGGLDETGTFVPASKYAVHRAITTAIEWGLLAEGSKALCLVVPGHRIKGYHGNENAVCDRHRQTGGRSKRASLRSVS